MSLDKEKMSRALGAAFLQHQVKQLEKNVEDLSFKRDSNRNSNNNNRNYSQNNNYNNSYYNNNNNRLNASSSSYSNRNFERFKPKTILKQPNHNDDDTLSSSSSHRKNYSSGNNSEKLEESSTNQNNRHIRESNVKVIDSSVLIYGLPLLKRWARESNFKIVVPLDVISTLDFLKTNPQVKNRVREATFWLDSQFQKNDGKRFVNIIEPQRTGEEICVGDLGRRFVSPPIEEACVPVIIKKEKEVNKDEDEEREGEEEEESLRRLEFNDLPIRLRSLFQCALWQQDQSKTSNPTEESSKTFTDSKATRLVVFLTKSQSSSEEASFSSSLLNSNSILTDLDYANGHNVSIWAKRFGIELESLSQIEIDESKEWIKNENEKRKSNHPTKNNHNSNHQNHQRRQNYNNSHRQIYQSNINQRQIYQKDSHNRQIHHNNLNCSQKQVFQNNNQRNQSKQNEIQKEESSNQKKILFNPNK